ncbi:MAG: hypothetical protein ACXABU_12705 [Candidatus Hodarchaeales archaeon]|jgi:hypothetical protein
MSKNPRNYLGTKQSLRKFIDDGARLRQYFLRGHGNWFALMFSLINFTLIFYNLLFVNLFFIPEYLKSFSVFFIIFGIIYFPIAVVVGWLDFKKGTYKAEQQLTRNISPIWKEVFSKLDHLEKQNQNVLNSLKTLETSEDR